MPELLQHIYQLLNQGQLSQNLGILFCERLLWGRPESPAFSRTLLWRGQEVQEISFVPIAQLGGLPVFQVKWPFTTLPNITQRRAVHRALANAYLEHVLAYVTEDDRQVSFVWARKRTAKKVEMRTLSFHTGSPARTTVGVTALAVGALVEIDMVARRPVGAGA
ncbi:MAG: hypothetical protein P1S60_13530 [Anaerolineae bacterium]|nr:hypothetical protein [Anaerolineae bacterium]